MPAPSPTAVLPRPLARIAGALGVTARAHAGRLIYERGLDTTDAVPLEDLGLADPERVGYTPSGWRWLRQALPPDEVGERDVFADLGSGKGRAVYVAARYYPFARVIGVELSDALTAVARRNLVVRGRRLRCRDVELVTCDVTAYAIPDDLSVVYLYNPFGPGVLARVLDRLADSLDRSPRRFRIVYANPVFEDLIAETGRFALARRIDLAGFAATGDSRPWISVYDGGRPG